MTIAPDRIGENVARVRQQIADAARRAGRAASDITLVAVTKSVAIEEVRVLVELGETHLGENRIHVAQPKIGALTTPVTWHMIGHVQRRKASDVVSLFDRVDSIDRVEVADALNKRCAEQSKHLDVLLEVNVSGEEVKYGFDPSEVEKALDQIRELPHLRVSGLMTMAPFVADPEQTRPVFAGLRILGDKLGLPELSMGMTNDYIVAVEEGATQVRVGSALFE